MKKKKKIKKLKKEIKALRKEQGLMTIQIMDIPRYRSKVASLESTIESLQKSPAVDAAQKLAAASPYHE